MENSSETKAKVVGVMLILSFIGVGYLLFKSNKNLNGFTWTKEKKKEAHDDLLIRANNYEVKQRKKLSHVVYLPDGRARWIGKAHDYTINIQEES